MVKKKHALGGFCLKRLMAVRGKVGVTFQYELMHGVVDYDKKH